MKRILLTFGLAAVIPLSTVAASMRFTLLVSDTFSDTNGTSIASHTISPTNIPSVSWSLDGVQNDVATIQSNRASCPAGGTNGTMYLVDMGASTVTSLSLDDNRGVITVGNASVGIVFRYVDSHNYWMAYHTTSGLTLKLYKIVADTPTEVDADNPGFGESTDYTINVTLSGNDIEANVNGANAVFTTDSTHASATKYGVICFVSNVSSTGVVWDNFTVNGSSGGSSFIPALINNLLRGGGR